MPLINKETIKSFLGDKSFITTIDDAAGFADAVKQAEDIVYQKTGVAIPTKTDDAIPTLQFCAHAITIYIMSIQQPLKDTEIDRKKSLYDAAMKTLDSIESGSFALRDKKGNVVTNTVRTFFCSEQEFREERI